VEARGLCAGYGSRLVLDDVNLQIEPGELVGLCGPNGSGKTTLLHCLTGYNSIRAGSVSLGRKPVNVLNRRQVAEMVAFVPQRTEQTFSYSVLEMVLMGRHPYAGLSLRDSEQDQAMATASLETLAITELAHRPYNELSGGEQQLVLLARAFVQSSPLLILDEPLTGLDIRHQFQLMHALSTGIGSAGQGALITFHDLAVAARWCTRLILLKAGQIIADDTPAHVLTASNVERLYGVRAAIHTEKNGTITSIEVQDLTV